MSVAFLLTSLVIVATPGTGVLFTVAAGLSRGARAGLVAAAGCTLGIVPHLAAAVTGAAAVLRAGGLLFETVRYLGVAYLLYMAWSTWRDRSALTLAADASPRSTRKVIGSAVAVNLLNPKLTLFFFAFLPQFVPADEPHALLRMLGLSLVFMAVTFVVFAGYGVFSASVRTHLVDRPRVVARVRRVLAASFAGLGLTLATTDR
jgi:threonine/homoserine/homoserine lactone efflux protein